MPKKENYLEKRSYKRFLFSARDRVFGEFELPDIFDGRVLFRILDISAGGLRYTIAREKAGEVVVGNNIFLHHVEGYPALEFVPHIKMEVKWVLDNPVFKNILVGCQFVDISETIKEKIDQFAGTREQAQEVVFCEECGNKNIVRSEDMAGIDEQPITCQICNNLISRETIISYSTNFKTLDTSAHHLLLIDDDLGHLRIMASMLQKKYNVTMAPTGKHGIELAQKTNPDLILLDVSMPDIDGHEVCTRLKENKKTCNIPIIFVTAEVSDDDEDIGLSLGAVDYITKPVDQQLLDARIAVQLKFKRLQDTYNEQIVERDDLIASLKKNSLEADVKLETIRQQKKNLETILNTTNNIVIIQNNEQQIIWANRNALTTFKTTLAEVTGKPCHTLFQNSGAACTDCPLSAGGIDGYSKLTELYSDKLDALLSLSHLPLLNDDGMLTGTAHLVKIIDSSSVGSGR